MPQVFRRGANPIFRAVILLIVLLLVALAAGGPAVLWSPWVTGAHIVHEQPIPFSHEHHAGRLGFDCRYCHTTVEVSSFAGIPPTKTCMNCHSQIWQGSAMLEPVRESYRTGQPIQWQRVHNLPQFVYFDHSIHVHKGIGCSTCHGRVDRMPLVQQALPLTMQWCLRCHREPQRFVRPRDQVFNMAWQPPPDQFLQGQDLVEEYQIQSLTSCSTCHR